MAVPFDRSNTLLNFKQRNRSLASGNVISLKDDNRRPREAGECKIISEYIFIVPHNAFMNFRILSLSVKQIVIQCIVNHTWVHIVIACIFVSCMHATNGV